MKRLYGSLLLIVISLALVACAPTEPIILEPLPTPTHPAEGSTPWINVYFSDPQNPDADTYRGGPDTHLAEAIASARSSVDAAIYDLDLWSIRNALINAHRRGVRVRVTTESNYITEAEIQDLIVAGIPVIGDGQDSLMHNKFIVIDEEDVWTGSMNLTVRGAYHNDNNLISVRSARLAENYLTEFEEMFTHGLFGDMIAAHTPYPTLAIEDTILETYFSPDDGAADQIIAKIEQAEESIHFAAFSFTSDEIAAALIERANHGVEVSGVLEQNQVKSNQGTELDRLVAAGIDVRLDANRDSMHHKFFVIDEQIVITGSYNFSRSAEERNDENVLIIQDKAMAKEYIDEFNRIFSRTEQET
jgi:phosphatidylserine/phosphatidylglycerophosphate/cardiolipin synthase-like enzyme